MNFLVFFSYYLLLIILFFSYCIFFVVSSNGGEIKAQICNAAVCSTTEIIPVVICEINEEERERAIDNILGEVRVTTNKQKK